MAAVLVAFALGAGGSALVRQSSVPGPSKPVEAPAGPMDVCLRPPLRVAECQAWIASQKKDAGR